MKITRSADLPRVPAGHEDPHAPGVWKKVLISRRDLQPGRVQMINWATLPVGKSFAGHYHEDMQEVFIMITGEVILTVDSVEEVLRPGDTVTIDPREVHQMRNRGDCEAEYLAIGIAGGNNGKTVVI